MSFLALVFATILVAVQSGPYTPDLIWPQDLPTTASLFTAVAIDTVRSEVYVAQRGNKYPQPVLVFDKEGNLLRTWGNTSVSNSNGEWGVHGLSYEKVNDTTGFVWLTDLGDHTVKKYSWDGKLLLTLGTKGVAGSGLSPLQFGNVADAAGDGSIVFLADGDGGVNNRVVAIDPTSGHVLYEIGGVAASSQPGLFNSPHSVAYFPDNKLVFVADRSNNRTEIFSSTNGKFLGQWTCTRPGTPWGVRVWAQQGLLYQADGNSQSFTILDLSSTSPTSAGTCNTLEVAAVDPTLCTTPHEIDVDPASGEVYIACIGAAHSKVLRYKQECGGKMGKACF